MVFSPFQTLVLLALAVPGAFAQPHYSLTILGDLGGGVSYAYGINSYGLVVGDSWTGRVNPSTGVLEDHAFVYGGVMTDLGTLGGSASYAYGNNNSGQIVGSSFTSGDNVRHAFLYSGGTMMDLGALPPWNQGGYVVTTVATGINDRGQVVGYATDSYGDNHAFLYSGGMMTDLGPRYAYAINNNGQVVGKNGASHAFLYSAGTTTDLGVLGGGGAAVSGAYGINDSGQIVGYATVYGGYYDAFLYSGGTMTMLPNTSQLRAYGINNYGQVVGDGAWLYSGGVTTNLSNLIGPTPGLALVESRGINDAGQIVGYGTAPSGQDRAFLLNPIPEPCSVALVAFGALAFLLFSRTRT
jgi:probable HAF family extracellular repeat protein